MDVGLDAVVAAIGSSNEGSVGILPLQSAASAVGDHAAILPVDFHGIHIPLPRFLDR
jgi:hypothetical protein